MTGSWRRLQPLGLCLLGAVVLHGLGLAGWQLQRSRQLGTAAGVGAPLSADDTPELLRFSRQQAQQNLMPAVVPLPGPELLPPPPPPEPAAQANAPSAAAARPGSRRPKGARSAVSARPTPVPRPRSGTPPAAGSSGAAEAEATGSAAAANVLAALDQLQRQVQTRGSQAEPGTERARAAGSDTRSPASGAKGAEAEAPGLRLLRPEPAEQEGYRSLWEKGQPAAGPRRDWSSLPGSLERRRLPLAQARRGAAAVQHREAVLLGEQLLLFWVVGDQLWMLRSPVAAGSGG
ncbi:MAG: hypothetical protein VKK62_05590 [Synechococcaceae cyanobacterium]|nr:hypothetical protein [Synechococcaceae cyanobacterium]